jgi:surface protein
MFYDSAFTKDINNWNVSNVIDMRSMFARSQFNSSLANWNTSNVKNMSFMFYQSIFNQDISNWDVSNVVDISCIFALSKFKEDLSNWKPYKISLFSDAFLDCECKVPEWFNCESKEERNKIILAYSLSKELNNTNKPNKKVKI